MLIFKAVRLFLLMGLVYVFTQVLHLRQDVTQGQFLSSVKMAWIQNFPFSWKVT